MLVDPLTPGAKVLGTALVSDVLECPDANAIV
jgi:hypothetical protein